MARSVSDEIEDLAAKRQAAWAEGDTEKAARIGEQLVALYDEKRRAAAPHGSPKARKKAMDRALAERELERLMS